jgi:hypothetical protein
MSYQSACRTNLTEVDPEDFPYMPDVGAVDIY